MYSCVSEIFIGGTGLVNFTFSVLGKLSAVIAWAEGGELLCSVKYGCALYVIFGMSERLLKFLLLFEVLRRFWFSFPDVGIPPTFTIPGVPINRRFPGVFGTVETLEAVGVANSGGDLGLFWSRPFKDIFEKEY